MCKLVSNCRGVPLLWLTAVTLARPGSALLPLSTQTHTQSDLCPTLPARGGDPTNVTTLSGVQISSELPALGLGLAGVPAAPWPLLIPLLERRPGGGRGSRGSRSSAQRKLLSHVPHHPGNCTVMTGTHLCDVNHSLQPH